ncbi:MAG: cobalamin-dependent protein [Nitrospirota bacterium]
MAGLRKVLFISTNRYRFPPVIPLGVEYLASSLRREGFEVQVLDLCFSESPKSDIARAVSDFAPEAICLSIRNVDTVLWPETEYFLPEVRDYVAYLRELTPAQIIMGGSALSADPEAILDYVGADVAVCGDGESALAPILREPHALSPFKGRVVVGSPSAPSALTRREKDFDYAAYVAEGGVHGFETHRGCSSSCAYCMEAKRPVAFREPREVVAELGALVESGFRDLHLCDSEFNEDLGYSLKFLREMAGEDLGLRWALYMKPGDSPPELMKLLRKSGAYLITLSVDSLPRDAGYRKGIEDIVRGARDAGIRTAVDLLAGVPRESESDTSRALDLFREVRPDEVVVNTHIRLYRKLGVTRVIEADASLRKFVSGGEAGGGYLAPVFYCHLDRERLRELIGGDGLFKIAGEDKGVNYQRA